MSVRSFGLPASSSTMRSIARCTSAVGSASSMSPPWRWRMRVRILSSPPIGSCMPLMPRGPHAMPQRPIGVSNRAKCWSVMAWLQTLHAPSYDLWMPNLGLEIVAIHPDSGEFSAQREIPPSTLSASPDMQTPSRQRIRHGLSRRGPGKGPPLVCVHGSLNDFRIWGCVIGPLTKRASRHRVSLRHFFPDHWDGKRRHLFDRAACRRPHRLHREARCSARSI